MTVFDVVVGTMIMMIPLIICAGVIGFYIGEMREAERWRTKQ